MIHAFFLLFFPISNGEGKNKGFPSYQQLLSLAKNGYTVAPNSRLFHWIFNA